MQVIPGRREPYSPFDPFQADGLAWRWSSKPRHHRAGSSCWPGSQRDAEPRNPSGSQIQLLIGLLNLLFRTQFFDADSRDGNINDSSFGVAWKRVSRAQTATATPTESASRHNRDLQFRPIHCTSAVHRPRRHGRESKC
jgi:hypothetical protein